MGYEQQKYISYSSGGWEVQDLGAGREGSSEDLLSGWPATFLL